MSDHEQGESMTTPIERGAEVLLRDYQSEYDGGELREFLPLARAVFESIDREGLARVLYEHEWGTGVYADRCKCGADTDGDHAAHQATAIRAWLLGEGGA